MVLKEILPDEINIIPVLQLLMNWLMPIKNKPKGFWMEELISC